MKVLLCLLSNQHIPNLLSIHHYKPDQLVLIESKAMKSLSVSHNLLKALQLGGLEYDNRTHIEPIDAEDDLDAVRQALQAVYGRFPSGSWIANVTGGTKPMSIATYEFFKALGGKIVYTNVSRPAQIMNLGDYTAETASRVLKIDEFLAGYGFESRKTKEKIEEAENRANSWIESATLLAQHCSTTDVLPLNDNERKKARAKGIELPASRFHWPDERLRKIWYPEATSRKLTKHEVEFFTGGWLEVFFWNLLRQHAEALGIWDVRLGLEVGLCGAQSGNDFDVSFMHGYGLSMVECKSGSQEHDPGTDILYKVEAVIQQFRALRVRSYLATTSDHVFDTGGTIKASLQQRSEIYKCKILTASDIRELANASSDVVDRIKDRMRLTANAG